MPLAKDFAKTLVENTDEVLYDMPTPPIDYLPEALNATARREILPRRNLKRRLLCFFLVFLFL